MRFWTSIEMDIGSFEDFGDVDLDEVTPLSLAVLQMCIDAYVAGLPARSSAPISRPAHCGPLEDPLLRHQGQRCSWAPRRRSRDV